MFERAKTPRVRSSLAAAVFLSTMLAAVPGLARSGGVAHLPQAGVKMKNGLTLEIDSRGAEAPGYRPFRVKLRNVPLVPSKYDRQVRVTLRGWHGNGVYGRLAVSQVVEIPEGATSGEAIIAIPRDSQMQYYLDLEVREGGERLEDLCTEYLTFPNRGWGGVVDEASPSFLFISSSVPPREDRDKLIAEDAAQIPEKTPTYDLPDVRNAVSGTFFGNTNIGRSTGKISDRSLLTLLETSSGVDLASPIELPERWIDLSTYSIIFISREDLRILATQHPRKKSALQEWLAVGAVLVIYDAGDGYQNLTEFEKLLELPPRPDAAKEGTPFSGWIPANLADKDRRAKNYGNRVASPSYYQNPAGQIVPIVPDPAANQETEVPAEKPEPYDPAKPPFVSWPAQLGWLIAVPDKNPFPGDADTWEWLLTSIPDQRESWSHRHGLTFSGNNDGFWKWHIAGVGAAPVFSFMLLASLFAVAIGPLNYLFLGRIQRLSLLLFTVPAGALMVTLALFLYAIAIDGLGVRSRVRSYTQLDQRSGQMVSWSRQTYFASVAPSRGLKYPADTLVFPVVLKPREGMTGYKAMDWEEDGQRLKSGFISSRSLAQFMVVRSAKTETRLEVIEPKPPLSRGGGQGEGKSAPRLQVRNTLGTKVQFLILRDSQGNYFTAENLPLDAAAEPAPATARDTQIALTKLIRKQTPEYPKDYDPTTSGNALTRMFRGAFPTSSYSPVSTDVSLLEKSFGQVAAPNADLLEPASYLALVDLALDVPMGVPDSKQQESLHLIRGHW
jgi:hypothetical protein